MKKNIIISTRKDFSSVFGWIDANSNTVICYLEDFQLYKLVLEFKQVSERIVFFLVLEDKHQSSFIRQMLTFEGFSDSQIIDFYSVFNALSPLMVVEKLLENPIKKDYKAIVLGISHAQADIVPEAMDVDTVNFAISSQDLYYNYKTLEYALHKYPDRFTGLEYLIIDMYHYNYFNVDLSRGKRTYEYLKWGGYNKDEHNFVLNKNFDCNFSQLNDFVLHERYEGIEREAINCWQSVFSPKNPIIHAQLYNRDRYFHNRNNIISDEIIDRFYYNPANVKKRFEDTIKENVGCFSNILKMAREFNPKIEIAVCLLPIYCEV